MNRKIIPFVGVILCIIARVTLGTDTFTGWDALGFAIGAGGGWMLGRWPSRST